MSDAFTPPERIALDAYDDASPSLEELCDEFGAALTEEEAARFFTADVLGALYNHADYLLAHLDDAAQARGIGCDGDERTAISLLRLLLGDPVMRRALMRLTAAVRLL